MNPLVVDGVTHTGGFGMKKKAREMRLAGGSIKGIAKTLGKSPSTVHGWVSDVPLSPEELAAVQRRGRTKAVETLQETHQRETVTMATETGRGLHPKQIGEKTEAQVLARLLMADKVVLQPFGDSQRYDLVVDEGGDFIRIQCKTALLKQDSFQFPTASSNWNSGARRNYIGQTDLFAVYVRELEAVYMFKVEGLPKRSCTARIGKKYGGTKMAKDHLFDPDKSLRDYP